MGTRGSRLGTPTLKPVSDFLCCSPLSLAGSFPGLAADVRSCQLGRPGTAAGGARGLSGRWEQSGKGAGVQLGKFVLQGAGR